MEDGTQCGSGMACLSQRCVPVSQIATAMCDLEATSSNQSVCSGNGVSHRRQSYPLKVIDGIISTQVCNNRGTCSCNVGFTGASCEASFTGASSEAPFTGASSEAPFTGASSEAPFTEPGGEWYPL